MTKKEVKIGECYLAKVSNKLVPVKILEILDVNRFGGWTALNVRTNRKIRIKSAQKLRMVIGNNGLVKRRCGKCGTCLLVAESWRENRVKLQKANSTEEAEVARQDHKRVVNNCPCDAPVEVKIATV